MIYISINKAKDYKYNITSYIIKKGKFCMYIISKYTNCIQIFDYIESPSRSKKGKNKKTLN